MTSLGLKIVWSSSSQGEFSPASICSHSLDSSLTSCPFCWLPKSLRFRLRRQADMRVYETLLVWKLPTTKGTVPDGLKMLREVPLCTTDSQMVEQEPSTSPAAAGLSVPQHMNLPLSLWKLTNLKLLSHAVHHKFLAQNMELAISY